MRAFASARQAIHRPYGENRRSTHAGIARGVRGTRVFDTLTQQTAIFRCYIYDEYVLLSLFIAVLSLCMHRPDTGMCRDY
jgi:hypothetical protein